MRKYLVDKVGGFVIHSFRTATRTKPPLGVRRVAAGESQTFLPDRKGDLFEHLVGNEILKWIRSQAHDIKLFFWRDPDGPEVDWVVQHENRLLPIKVKLKSNPKESDARHLVTFMNEYSQAKSAWVI